jgi:hypothetical protein
MNNNKTNKKLYVIEGPGYNWDYFIPRIDKIQAHFDRLLKEVNIFTPSGKATHIKLNIDVLNPEKISATAKRVSKDPAWYEIEMTAGLSYHLWVASRALAFEEFNLLPWTEECKIHDEELKKLSKKEALADYAYFIGSYYVILHEFSHVLLGHCDYTKDEMGLNYLSEFQDENKQYSLKEIKIRKALEAEADRQAGEFLLVFFENSLGKNGLGGYLSFPSKLQAYEFYVYAITIVFRILQDLTQGKEVVHPRPNERLYILIGSLSKYFSQNFPNEHDKIYNHAVKYCLEAGEKLLVIDSYDPWTVILNAHNLAFVDDVIQEKNIRSYQHKLEVVSLK